MDTVILMLAPILAVFLFGYSLYRVGSAVRHLYMQKYRCPRLCKCKTQATVADVKIKRETTRHATLVPVFEYCVNGQCYRFTQTYGSYNGDYGVGSVVDLYYDENDPTTCYVPLDDGVYWRGAIFRIILGVVGVALSCFIGWALIQTFTL